MEMVDGVSLRYNEAVRQKRDYEEKPKRRSQCQMKCIDTGCVRYRVKHLRLTTNRLSVCRPPAGSIFFWLTPAILVRNRISLARNMLRQINRDKINMKQTLSDMPLFSAWWSSDRDNSSEHGAQATTGSAQDRRKRFISKKVCTLTKADRFLIRFDKI